MDCVGSAVLSTYNSVGALSGTVATLFKRVSNTEVCIHNYRTNVNIYITHILLCIYLLQIVQNCIYILVLYSMLGIRGYAVC